MRTLVLELFQMSEASVPMQMNLLKDLTQRKQSKDITFIGNYLLTNFKEAWCHRQRAYGLSLPSAVSTRAKQQKSSSDWIGFLNETKIT